MGDINGHWQNDPVMAKFANGALEIFGVGTDGALWHRWQAAPNSGWVDGWHRFRDNFGAEPAIFDAVTSRPSVVLNDGRFWVFLRSARGRILYLRHEPGLGAWSDWRSIGGIVEGGDPVVGNPMAIIKDNRIHIFARGRSGDVCVKVQQRTGSDDWGNWSSWAGVISGDPCPFANDSGPQRQILVYARGLDQQTYVKGEVQTETAINRFSSRVIEWTALGCPGDSGALVSGCPVPRLTSVSWRGVDGLLRSKQQMREAGVYDSRCENLNFAAAGDPVDCFHTDGSADVYWRAPDGGLMRRFRPAGQAWNAPVRIADGLLGQPVVNTSENNRVEIIFRRGSSGELSHIFQAVRYGPFSS